MTNQYWNSGIAENIFENRNDIVPVIGENCFFYYSKDGAKIRLQDFLIDRIVERCRNRESLTESLISQMKTKGFYGLSLCRQRCGFRSDEEFLKCYKSVIRENKQDIHLDETVKDFLLSYNFHLLITTCCFDFIETDLPPYYVPKVYVAANGANNKEEILVDDYTIYHVFGKYDNASIWAWDEEALMYILHCHHNSDYASSGLRRFIFPDQNSATSIKSLLILYGNLPDWLFRFFLYPLAYDSKWTSGFYLNSPIGQEDGLKNFIESVICYDVEESNIDSTLRTAVKLLPEKSTCGTNRVEHCMKYDIFISHTIEDKEIALQVKSKLEKLYGLKIWLDVGGGIEDGTYVDRMRSGIENSAYFMPLITAAYIGKLKNKVCDLQMTLDDILKDDGIMSYVQKEALAAEYQRRYLFKKYPFRKSYLLPVISQRSGLTIDGLKQCYGPLGQLPESLFREQSVFQLETMFKDNKDWSRYRTIEKE